ncbi:zinc finger protein 395-like [Fopius arisanus]|uniref:Zinc finger protein 395-like n=1 Tax=Fopius arisanus TaxID=64838 RepID=A0A9R1U7A9_9HYME|nr:PREDICTED: zinc finger protein 395-like [Fopius arisanus]
MMSVGKRLAKRSIIGSRVAAPGTDGKYYGGTIRAIKTPASATGDAGLSLTPETLYSVKFDEIGGKQPPISTTEYLERDLIGRGFGCINHVRLLPGQTVYFTHNSREVKAEVIQHKEHQKEVEVKILPTKDRKLPMNVMKRIGQLRLLACRKSPRLADQKTDFAKMADMNSDRKRATSDSIDVPHVPGSRKRRPSSRNSSERSWPENNNSNSASPTDMGDEHMCVREGCTNQGDHGACMDDCTAAVALLSLLHSSVSPKNVPSPNPSEPSFGTAGTSNSSSSSGSWRSTPSPVVLSAGASPTEVSAWPSSSHASGSPTSIPSCSSYGSMPGSSGSTPGSSVSIPGLSGSIPGSSGSTPGSSLMLDEGVCLPDFDMRLKEKNKRKPTKKLVANPRKPTQPTQGYIFEDCGRVSKIFIYHKKYFIHR